MTGGPRLLAAGVLASLLLPALAAHAPEPSLQPLVCSGNEPFWRLDIGPGTALLRRLGASGSEEVVLQGELRRLAFLDPPWSVWRGHARGDPTQVVVATVRAEVCHDTMADLPPFDHRAVVSFPDGEAATGCCRAAADPQPGG